MTIARILNQNTRWPLDQLTSFREEMNRLFGAAGSGLAFDENTQPFLSGWTPAIDVYEDADRLLVRAELPGMKKEEIELSLHEGVLTLSGERTETVEPEAKPYRTERYVGRFSRTVSLPSPVVAEKVAATYRDGILTVTLPKAEEAKPKQIRVETN